MQQILLLEWILDSQVVKRGERVLAIQMQRKPLMANSPVG